MKIVVNNYNSMPEQVEENKKNINTLQQELDEIDLTQYYTKDAIDGMLDDYVNKTANDSIEGQKTFVNGLLIESYCKIGEDNSTYIEYEYKPSNKSTLKLINFNAVIALEENKVHIEATNENVLYPPMDSFVINSIGSNYKFDEYVYANGLSYYNSAMTNTYGYECGLVTFSDRADTEYNTSENVFLFGKIDRQTKTIIGCTIENDDLYLHSSSKTKVSASKLIDRAVYTHTISATLDNRSMVIRIKAPQKTQISNAQQLYNLLENSYQKDIKFAGNLEATFQILAYTFSSTGGSGIITYWESDAPISLKYNMSTSFVDNVQEN